MPTFELATTAARITVETETEGALADAAYDLTLAAACRATARIDPGNLAASTGTVEIAAGAFRVEALRRRLTGHSSRPSDSDARKIADKTHGELSAAFGDALRATIREATRLADGRLEATARVQTKRGERAIPVRLAVTLDGDRRARIDAELEVSLAALGIGPVKGPLGLFRVADRVRVRARAELQA